MTTIETNMTDIRATWAALLPSATPPADHQFNLWLVLHDAATVTRGLAELATKYHRMHGKMDPDYRVKFASAVMNRIEREQRNATAS